MILADISSPFMRGQESKRSTVIFLYISILCALCSTFYIAIVPIYGYTGFEWAPNILKAFEATVIVIILASGLPRKALKPSDILIHVHMLLPIMPMITLYACSDLSRYFMYISAGGFLAVMLLRNFPLMTPLLIRSFTPNQLMYMLLAATMIIILSIIALGGARFWNLDLSSVYKYRTISEESLPTAFGYLRPLAANVFIPLAILLSIFYKKQLITILAISMCIILFGLTAHKGVLFYPFIVLGIYYALKSKGSILTIHLVTLSCLCAASLIVYATGQSFFLDNIIVRRAIFLPAVINFWYFDFFEYNRYIFWANSKVTFGFLDYPYGIPVSRLLGFEHYGSDRANLNTGWIGAGFMNAGIAGILIYSGIIGFLLRYLDSVARLLGMRFVTATSSIPMLTLFTSSDLPSTFLNHGIIVLILIYSTIELRPETMAPTTSRNRKKSRLSKGKRPTKSPQSSTKISRKK